MAITFREDAETRGIKIGEDGVFTGDRKWFVTADLDGLDREKIEKEILDAFTVQRYDSHPSFPAAYARTCDLKYDGAHEHFTILVGYSSAPLAAGTSPGAMPGGGGGGGDPAKPGKEQDKSTPAVDRLPVVTRGKQTAEQALEEDVVTDEPVLNTVGDPFDPPHLVPRSYQTINVTFWRGADWALYPDLDTFYETVNDTELEILGVTYPEKTLLVTDLTDKWVWDTVEGTGGQTTVGLVIEVSLTLLVDWDTHVANILNRGRRARPAPGQDPVQVVDKTGHAVSEPVLLAEDGTQLAPGADPFYLEVDQYTPAAVQALWS